MSQVIDCFFIGHNEMDFVEYEKEVRKMGIHSGAYRDLNLNFIRYSNKSYSASDIFNLFYLSDNGGSHPGKEPRPLNLGETFSAAVAYLGTYLKRRGLSFDYLNSFQDHKQELAEKLSKENILTIAIITTLYVSVYPILEIMDFIKRYNQEARIIIGGPFVTTQSRTMDAKALEYLFKSIGADIYVNSSQGEATLVNVINALKNNLSLDPIHNIYYLSDNRPGGSYIGTPIKEENNPLSENMVEWDLFSEGVGEYAAVRTAISCPFSCSFCGFPEHAGKYRTAAVAAVEKELNQLAAIKSVKSVNIIDDTFNVPPKRFKEILRVMIRNQYPFQWNSHFRCQFADRETVELMKASGCEGVFLGIESGNDKILRNMNKAATTDQYLKGIELLREYGILTYGSFIIGFPGETAETVQDTLRFIKKSGLDFFRAQLWYCETLTPIWEKREEYKIRGSSFEWTHAAMDAKTACDWVEEIFLSLESPTWVPQYNFECDGLFHLLHRGFDPGQVKNFLESFNNGIKEKLKNPYAGEVSCDTIMELKKACQGRDLFDDDGIDGKAQQIKIDLSKVDFDL